MESSITVENLSHSYGTRRALDNVSFTVSCGEIISFLGPNGSGKTTLFKILSTLIPYTEGNVNILGYDLKTEVKAIRRLLGVVFQQPGLDSKLNVCENLRHHGHLYGWKGKNLNLRISELLEKFDIIDRANDLVEELSGGLQRRVEIAKAMLHTPSVLLLDEPSSGLDIGIRKQLHAYLSSLAESENILILLTTHLIDDAEISNRIGILDKGRLIILGTPDELKEKIVGDVVLIDTDNTESLCKEISDRFGVSPTITENTLHIECEKGHEFVREVVDTFPDLITNVSVGKPTLEDVFLKLTGNPLV